MLGTCAGVFETLRSSRFWSDGPWGAEAHRVKSECRLQVRKREDQIRRHGWGDADTGSGAPWAGLLEPHKTAYRDLYHISRTS